MKRQFPELGKRLGHASADLEAESQPALGLTRFLAREDDGKADVTCEDLPCFLQGSS